MPEKDRIPTNLRTLLILEVLGSSDRAMTATEMNEVLGLPKQTVHRLCATLEAEGFLTRQGNSKRFQPARRLRDLGAGLLHASRSHILRRQILLDVAEKVGETVNFVVPSDDGMSYLDRVETDWPLRIQFPIGSSVPFHCTASGKCFMASLPDRIRRRFVENLNLSAKTPATRTQRQDLLEDLSRTAKRGYSLDEEEFIQSMIAIAVPVRDPKGRFHAAIAFQAPAQRVTIGEAIERRDILQEGAKRLSRALFAEEDT